MQIIVDKPTILSKAVDTSHESQIKGLVEVSLESQRAQYKVATGRLWIDDWIVLTEIPKSHEDAAKVIAKVIKAIGESQFSRFMRTYTPEELYAIPREAVEKLKSYKERTVFRGYDFKQVGITGCLVSPKKIGAEWAAHLGLATAGLNQINLVRALSDVEVIELHKEIWKSACPLERNNLRVLRVPTSVALEGDTGFVGGSIIYVKGTSRREGAGSAKESQFFPTAYAAYRRTIIVENNYKSERLAISTLSAETRELAGVLDEKWRKNCSTDEKQNLREEAAALLIKGQATLENAVNAHKIKALEYLSKGSTIQDSRGHDNPSVALNQMSAGLKELAKRMEETLEKGSYNAKDNYLLKTAIDLHEDIFDFFKKNLRERSALINSGSLLFNPNEKLGRDKIVHQVRGLTKGLARAYGRLNDIELRPFTTFSTALQQGFRELSLEMARQNLAKSEDSINTMDRVLRFYTANKWVEDIRLQVEDVTPPPLADMRQSLGIIITLLETPKPFPDDKGELLDTELDTILTRLKRVSNRLSHYIRQELSADERVPVLERLKAHLRPLNVEKIFSDTIKTQRNLAKAVGSETGAHCNLHLK